MKKLIVGILAHVDAGKTTLSESLLYLSGKIRQVGRVDNKDTYLDTDALEKSRGITIFSKQAELDFDHMSISLLDTPGHVDFSTEMERTLQVLDYAILVVSAADGVQGHTRTLWRLLQIYKIPTFIFVNKMDQDRIHRTQGLEMLKNQLADTCIAFDGEKDEAWYEQVALCNEDIMETYLETGQIADERISDLIQQRQVFPVYFGSALKQVGVEAFLEGMATYTKAPLYGSIFGARVYKITRDQQGQRLTHLKITGGCLKVKDVVPYEHHEEKINQIRLYSGNKFQAVIELRAGHICAVTGLNHTRAGQGLGGEKSAISSQLEPVLSYGILLPEDVDVQQILPKLKELEEEEPALRIVWNDSLQELTAQIMGAVQIEILQSIVMERFGLAINFGEGKIVYKETIGQLVEGVGHFEPLRHYAEVHLLLRPSDRGSGISFDNTCSEDILDKNWQRLVITHLQEKKHLGVLTGSPITDMKITLVAGRGHPKHTAGGDFREATFRALRQGLKQARSILLEPYYAFELELPEQYVGRAMTDIDKMHGQCVLHQNQDQMALLIGQAPVSTMRNYQQTINTYTKGYGKLRIRIQGYDICHNPEPVIEAIGYDADRDVSNPSSSVFCANGTGFIVPWDQVKDHMHVESVLQAEKKQENGRVTQRPLVEEESFISLEEIDAIMNSTYYANRGKKSIWKKKKTALESHYDAVTYKGSMKPSTAEEEYLLVDGYNIIFAWPELESLSEESMEAARGKLIDILSNYQPIRKAKIMVVFDAYRVEGRGEYVETYHNIRVVFTAEAQTADQYIEKFAHANRKKYRITVATSDGLQQVIIRGAGAGLVSARELRQGILEAEDDLNKIHLNHENGQRDTLEEVLTEEEKARLIALKKL